MDLWQGVYGHAVNAMLRCNIGDFDLNKKAYLHSCKTRDETMSRWGRIENRQFK